MCEPAFWSRGSSPCDFFGVLLLVSNPFPSRYGHYAPLCLSLVPLPTGSIPGQDKGTGPAALMLKPASQPGKSAVLTSLLRVASQKTKLEEMSQTLTSGNALSGFRWRRLSARVEYLAGRLGIRDAK